MKEETAEESAENWERVPGAEEPDEQKRIEDLDMVTELSHPMRSSILRALRAPKTVAEVANLLDMPVTRLYHHFNRLENLGLIRVVATRRAGAATERRYQVSAKSFGLAPELLESADRRELAFALGSIFDTSKMAFQREVEHGLLAGDGFEDRAVVSQGSLVLSAERQRELMQRLTDLIEEFESDADESDPGAQRVMLFIAAFPESR